MLDTRRDQCLTCSPSLQDEVQRGISPEKIAIVGVGQGGCVALSAALRGYRYEETDVQVEGGEVAAIGEGSAEEDEDDWRSKKSSGSEILRVAAVAGRPQTCCLVRLRTSYYALSLACVSCFAPTLNLCIIWAVN
jgi:hypothetical protein